MNKSLEPFLWSLFGAGGVASALVLPVLLFLIGIAIPLHVLPMPSYEHISALTSNVFARIFLFGVVTLSLFHWAHRFRFTLYDGLQLKHLNALIAVLCYGTATAISIFAAYSFFIS